MQLLKVEEVMARLQISRPVVYRLLQSGELPSLKIGRSRRVSEAALEEFIQACQEDAN
ncbi:MAG: helix-turn-helix domain-containing protein [Chloroflexi bacterium]|nr:helix-turn-helix domain-containing protein [Chloroflexota bacterium]